MYTVEFYDTLFLFLISELILSNALTFKIHILHSNFVDFFNRSYSYAEKNLLRYSTKAKLFG